MEKLLDVKQLSEILKISINTIYCWVSQKRIPYLKIGKCLRFSETDIMNWISQSNKDHHKKQVIKFPGIGEISK